MCSFKGMNSLYDSLAFDVCDVVGRPALDVVRTERKAVGEAGNTSRVLILFVLAHRLAVTIRCRFSQQGTIVSVGNLATSLRAIND